MRLRWTSLVWLLAAATLEAQTFRGGIRGTVSDSTNAALPGVTVTATQVGTGLARTAITDTAGTYAFSELPLGDWNVTAVLTGFSTGTSKGVHVDASSLRRVDFVLAAGRRSESVDVVARSALVDSTGNTQGGTIEGRQAAELPVNGRDFTKLLSMVPGTAADPSSINDSPGSFGLFSANGNRGRSNNYLLDGTDMNDGYRNLPAINQGGVFGTPSTILPVDAVDEFPILSGVEAEYGRNAGAIVNIVTRSGTNDWHGSGFRVLPQRGPRRAQLLQRQAAAQERVQQPPVRRLARRPDRQGPHLLLPGLRRPARGRRHPGPVQGPDGRRARGRDRGERRRRQPGDRGPARAPAVAVAEPGAGRRGQQPAGDDSVLERRSTT